MLKIIEKAAGLNVNKRLSFYLDFYKSDFRFIEIKKYYKKGNFCKALKKLVDFIKDNRKYLYLDILFIEENDFVDKYLNDYKLFGFENHGVIKTLYQLKKIEEKFVKQKKRKELKKIKKIIDLANKNSHSLIILDKLANCQETFKELSHELNAWLISNSSVITQMIKPFKQDWRIYLPKNNIHRKLDNFFNK